MNLSVQFRTGSAELTPAARRTLDELGKALSDAQLAPYRFRIEGHTDTVMPRAEAVELLEAIRWAGELVGKPTPDGRSPEEETVLAAAREELRAEPSELQADLLRAFLAGRRV